MDRYASFESAPEFVSWAISSAYSEVIEGLVSSNLMERALEIDFLSSSSMTISKASFPVKKINGIWHMRTTRKIALRKKDSHSPLSLSTLLSTSSDRADPNMSTQTAEKRR